MSEPSIVTTPHTVHRGPKEYAYLVATGMAMGAADVVPGVSGGTMAFILGIYEELIAAIKSVNIDFVKLVLRGRFAKAFEHIHGFFLIALGSGIISAFLALAHPITWLLEHHRPPLFAFFFGLILASIVTIAAQMQWKPGSIFTLAGGAIAGYIIVGMVPVSMPHGPVYLFASGAVAICAMILPGISGSFILLILGQYTYIMNGLKSADIAIIAPVIAGIVCGIMAFSRLLNLLLKRYHALTIAALVGFMIGSLRTIWPFKVVVEYTTDRHGATVPLIEHNILPTVSSGAFWLALGLCLAGFVLICALDHTQSRANPVVKLFFGRGKRRVE